MIDCYHYPIPSVQEFSMYIRTLSQLTHILEKMMPIEKKKTLTSGPFPMSLGEYTHHT